MVEAPWYSNEFCWSLSTNPMDSSLAQVVLSLAGAYLLFWWQKRNMLDSPRPSINHKDQNSSLELVLDGRNTFQWSLEMLQANSQAEEVRLVNYSHNTTVKILDHQALVKVFEAVAVLPRLFKVSIDFSSPLPMEPMTRLLKELRLQKNFGGSKTWWKMHAWQPPATTQVQSLEIAVPELAGSQHDLREMSGQLLQFDSLRNLAIRCLGNTDQLQRMERDLGFILTRALQGHRMLQVLHLTVPIPPLPPKETSTPLVDAMVSLLENNRTLRQLRLYNSFIEANPWYLAPLAGALSLPTSSTESSLQSLQFQFASRLPNLEDPVVLQSMVALEQMIQCNYNLTNVSVRAADWKNLLYERNWRASSNGDKDAAATACKRWGPNHSLFYTMLNQLGRKRLLCDPHTTREDWIQTILRDQQNVGVIFYWLSMNPTLLPRG